MTTEQACAVAAVRLMLEAGEDEIARKLAVDIVPALFADEPLVETLRMIFDGHYSVEPVAA